MTKEEINSFSYRISQASRTDLVVIMLDMAKQYVKDAESAYDGGNDDEDHKILVGKQCLQLIPQGHFLLIQPGILCRHIFGDAFTGIVVFQKQQRNGRHR